MKRREPRELTPLEEAKRQRRENEDNAELAHTIMRFWQSAIRRRIVREISPIAQVEIQRIRRGGGR